MGALRGLRQPHLFIFWNESPTLRCLNFMHFYVYSVRTSFCFRYTWKRMYIYHSSVKLEKLHYTNICFSPCGGTSSIWLVIVCLWVATRVWGVDFSVWVCCLTKFAYYFFWLEQEIEKLMISEDFKVLVSSWLEQMI